jgi:hypothetical protein
MMAGEPPVRRISRRPLFTAAGQFQQAPAPLGGGLVKAASKYPNNNPDLDDSWPMRFRSQ